MKLLHAWTTVQYSKFCFRSIPELVRCSYSKSSVSEKNFNIKSVQNLKSNIQVEDFVFKKKVSSVIGRKGSF